MPERIPKAQVDLEDLTVHEGAPVLLRRALAKLAAGELLEVRGDSPELAEELAAWCRKEGHRYLGEDTGPNTYRIERSAGLAPLMVSGQRHRRGCRPPLGFGATRCANRGGGAGVRVHLAPEARDLGSGTDRAFTSRQWETNGPPRATSLGIIFPSCRRRSKSAVCQIMTFLTENEFAALYVPARFIPRIHPHYREVVEVLAVQIVDEARHAEAFTRRAEAGGSGLGTSAVSGQLSLQTLLEEPDFTTATFLLCVMGEGTFLTLLKFLEEHAPEAVTATLARLAHRDEARHVAFGMEHLRYVLEREPERRTSLAAAVERRSRMLAAISGLSPYVYDALTVLAGGGISPRQVREGARHVAALHREMDRARRERLQSLRFDAEEARTLSAYHTKNFM